MTPELNSKIIDYAKANAATEQETFNEERYCGLIDGITEVIQNPGRYGIGVVADEETRKLIAGLRENISRHMNPYNLGDEGETTKQINRLIWIVENRQPSIGPVWVNAGFKFPDDWEVKHLRYVADHYPVENSLFEHIRNGLCKIDGTGRLEYHEFEWLDDSNSTPSQDVGVLVRGLEEVKRCCLATGPEEDKRDRVINDILKRAEKALKQFNQ